MARVTRRTHRILGLVMLLPICAWAVTGFIFFVKPGYGAAYGGLQVRRYSLEGAAIPQPRPEWLELDWPTLSLQQSGRTRGASMAT
jgi:hypothetical protein